MKDLNELLTFLAVETNKEDKDLAFKSVINEIEKFYTENLGLDQWEVAIFLTDAEKSVLSFACPEYLVNSGMIPVSSTESFASSIYSTGRSIILNQLQQHKHLSIFEIIRTPDKKIKPVWKLIGTLIAVGDDKFGVIQISRRSVYEREAGEDFSDTNLLFLENTINRIAPYIRRVMPQNFRGRVT